MKKHKTLLRLLLTVAIICAGYVTIDKNFVTAEDETPPLAFYDVNKGDTYYVAISKLREWDIIEGYEDGTFKPGISINRAEALKMITLSTGVFTEEEMEDKIETEETEETEEVEESVAEESVAEESVVEESVAEESVVEESVVEESVVEDEMEEADEIEEVEETTPFPDTPLEEWYTKYLIAAKALGIIHGHPDGTFRPADEINLVETLKILFESIQTQKELDFESTREYLYEDTPPEEWFTIYTSYAGAKGIINIYPTNTVAPAQKMSRGYLAEVMYRSIMSEKGYDFGKATWYGGAFQGNTTASGETFDKNELTAAHKHLPFNTIVEVTNLANGESVEVRITDRGPYGPGRVIDLSSEAFSRIASLGAGVINVQYKVVHLP